MGRRLSNADLFFEALVGDSVQEEAESDADLFYFELLGRSPPRPRRPRGETVVVDETSPPAPPRAALIRWAQEALVRAGLGPVTADGNLNAQTVAALRRFQQQHSLRSDGRLLSDTAHALARTTGALPPGVWSGQPPTHRGATPDLGAACPEPPTILDRFAFGNAQPTAAHRTEIGRIAQTIVSSWSTPNPVHWVCLEGHADSVGSLDANEALGQRRAEAIQAELVTAIDRLDASVTRRTGMWSTTFGETKPLVPGSGEAERARNRRVEVRLNRTWRGGGVQTRGGVTIGPARPRVGARRNEAEQLATFTVPACRTIGLVATGHPTPVGTPGYTWVIADPSIATARQNVGTQQHPNQVTVRGSSPGSTTITVTYRTSTAQTFTNTSTITVTAPAATTVTRYGCHDLRRGDKDRDPSDSNRPRWGGVARAAATVCVPAPASPPVDHVRQLQDDLRTLGFLIVGTPSGTFDRATEWAVREFQIYAKMETVARVRPGSPANLRRSAHLVAAALGHDAATNQSEYVASLDAVSNTACYTGRVSGVVNAATRAALDHWLTNDWRCPVVIEAWSMRAGARHRPAAVNLWLHDSHASTAPRFFARDFTGYYTLPATHNAGDMHVIGDFATYQTWSGPRSVPPSHTWAEGELLPAALTGTAAPAGATLSTYRVVRAVSEVECIGFFDSVNCYDNAFVSVGPCHWTLGIVDAASFSEGELCGYLAYLRNVDPAAFFAAFEFFGVRIDENWVSRAGPADGADLFARGSRKYTGWVAMQQDNGTFTRLTGSEAEGNYFKTWHWHYRFVMAGRTIEGYRRRMWDMARVRLRDIRSVPWGAGVAQVGAGATARPATIGDVFTSERAIAMLQRWHIRSPGHVIAAGAPATRLRNALSNAQTAGSTLTWTGDPSAWTNDHERHLIDGIRSAAAAGVRATLDYVRDWPNWLGGANPRGFTLAPPIASALSADRGSFQMDAAGLPPAPP